VFAVRILNELSDIEKSGCPTNQRERIGALAVDFSAFSKQQVLEPHCYQKFLAEFQRRTRAWKRAKVCNSRNVRRQEDLREYEKMVSRIHEMEYGQSVGFVKNYRALLL
jgi:hypothetical protein